jgi:mannose-6-phosphate isomerase-like protein (cupin superfamily)
MKTASTDYFNDTLQNKAVIFLPGEGEVIKAGEGSCTLKITSEISNDQLGIYEIVVPPHTLGARLHYHRFMDETFIVKSGILTVQAADKESHLEAGSLIYIPRFTPHAFSNTSDVPVTVTLIFNPSQQREGFFYGLFELLSAPEMDTVKFLKLYHKYDSFLVNPVTMQPA